MAVTELATLPLTHSITKDNPILPEPLVQKLKTAKAVLEYASGYAFHYFQQVEEPSVIYIIGKWNSVATHHKFILSKENQGLLELLKDDVVAPGGGDRAMTMWHLDTDIFALDALSAEKSVFAAPTISCNRHFVPTEKKDAFTDKFQEVRGLLGIYTKPFQVVGGWRVEKEAPQGKEREEFALFSGFTSVENHTGFAKTDEFTKYREIVDFVEGFEAKHLTTIESLL